MGVGEGSELEVDKGILKRIKVTYALADSN
jgi:hypothetical protein